MTLEFSKVVDQVFKMGVMLEKLDFDISESLALARERFQQASDLKAVWERIDWVRQSDISGYRGAAPVNLPNAEPVNHIEPAPPIPEEALLLAADGSQIYPDEQAPVHYYLLNIGLFVYYHGFDQVPEQYTFPELYFHKAHVHDRYGRIITNRTVDDRRTVAELQRLAVAAWERRDFGLPMIALYDNRLMYLPGNGGDESDQLLKDYMASLVHLHDSGASLAGYIDNPFRSKRFIQLLYLLSLNSEEELKLHQLELAQAGDLDGLRDQQFFNAVLQDGERSAIMVQNSPQNKVFKDKGENYEIAFFYLKVSNAYQSKVVRVDIPVWVARDKRRVDDLHALLLLQCKMQGRNPYPYAITRADEIAVVAHKERLKMEQLVNAQVRRVQENLTMQTVTAKMRGKELARSEKRYFDVWGMREVDRE